MPMAGHRSPVSQPEPGIFILGDAIEVVDIQMVAASQHIVIARKAPA